MHFHVISLFPEMIETAAKAGVIGQAITKGKLGLTSVSPRQFTTDVHHTVDDRPFGGGDGMIMLAETLTQALEHVKQAIPQETSSKTIHVSPRGTPFTDAKARELATYDHLVLISSRYGGADQRFLNSHVDEEISLGDFILTGGELAVLVMIDAIGRLQAGVLGNDRSSENESFAGALGLLENPQFTRPRDWRGQGVPKNLMSGDHAKIKEFQESLMLLVSAERRPDLIEKSYDEMTWKQVDAALRTLDRLEADGEAELCGLRDLSAIREILSQLLSALPEPKPKRERRK